MTSFALERTVREAIESPPDSHAGLAELRRVRPRLLHAYRLGQARRDPAAAELLLALDPLLVLDAPFERYASWLEAALALAPDAEPRVHAGLLRASARFWSLRGAHRVARRALRAARDVTVPRTESPLHAGLRNVVAVHAGSYLDAGDPLGGEIEAIEVAARAAAAHRGRLRALAGQARGIVDLLAGRHARAAEASEAAIDHARSAGAERTLAIALANLGSAVAPISVERAAAAYAKSLALFARVGDRLHVEFVRAHLLLLASARGEPLDVDAVMAVVERAERLGQARIGAELLLLLVERSKRATLRARASGWLDRAWAMLARADAPDLEAKARALSEAWGRSPRRGGRATLLVGGEADLASFAGRTIDLRTRRALPGVLRALVSARLESPGSRLDVSALFASGWPGQKALAHAAAARVYMAIRSLRALGFGDAITTSDEGYRIEPHVDVELRERLI